MEELSLRPYNGRLFIAHSRKNYEKTHVKVFNTPDVLNCSQVGRFSGGEGKDGTWTYVVWGESTPQVVHELAHVVLHVFERVGIDPREAGGEPFCYMLSQLVLESKDGISKP